MTLKLRNNAASSLAAALTDSETMIRILAGHGDKFPTLSDGDWFPLAIQNVRGEIEYVRATSRVGDVFVVKRGQEKTPPMEFDAGDAIYLPLTVAAIESLPISAGVSISIEDATVTA